MSGHLETIVSLHKTLIELTAANQRLNSIPEWMSELHEEHSEKKAGIEEVEAAAATADQERREAEAELADAQETQKRYQEQLGQVSTQREYGALLKEIDTTKSQISASEQKALEAAERKEESDAKSAEMREAFSDLDGRYNAELAKWESEKPAVAAAAKQLETSADELRAAVPRNTLVLFDRLYEHCGGEALSRVMKMEVARGNAMWHCAACSYNVRPQILVEIRNEGSVNQCDSCKRILFWEDEE
ncbi:MAG: hypothetical protein GY719_18595 [bacterium]|nr:hypothetical protein [bacterium]